MTLEAVPLVKEQNISTNTNTSIITIPWSLLFFVLFIYLIFDEKMYMRFRKVGRFMIDFSRSVWHWFHRHSNNQGKISLDINSSNDKIASDNNNNDTNSDLSLSQNIESVTYDTSLQNVTNNKMGPPSIYPNKKKKRSLNASKSSATIITETATATPLTVETPPSRKRRSSRSSKNDMGREPRKRVTTLARDIIGARQSWSCAHCIKLLTPGYEIDHINPLFKGGTNDESNLQALCRNCHGIKTILERQKKPDGII